jgi:serine protease Do
VAIAEVSKDVAESLGVRPVGALVRSVEKDGPAEKAGLEAGDIVLKWDGKNVEKSTDLPRLVANSRPGSRVSLQVWRKGQLRDLTVLVAEMSSEPRAQAASKPGPVASEANALGLVTIDLTDMQKRELRVKGGVVVEAAEGPAARAGMRQGDIVLSINNTDLTSTRQFNELVTKLDRNKAAVLLVRRGDSASFIPVRPVTR